VSVIDSSAAGSQAVHDADQLYPIITCVRRDNVSGNGKQSVHMFHIDGLKYGFCHWTECVV